VRVISIMRTKTGRFFDTLPKVYKRNRKRQRKRKSPYPTDTKKHKKCDYPRTRKPAHDAQEFTAFTRRKPVKIERGCTPKAAKHRRAQPKPPPRAAMVLYHCPYQNTRKDGHTMQNTNQRSTLTPEDRQFLYLVHNQREQLEGRLESLGLLESFKAAEREAEADPETFGWIKVIVGTFLDFLQEQPCSVMADPDAQLVAKALHELMPGLPIGSKLELYAAIYAEGFSRGMLVTADPAEGRA